MRCRRGPSPRRSRWRSSAPSLLMPAGGARRPASAVRSARVRRRGRRARRARRRRLVAGLVSADASDAFAPFVLAVFAAVRVAFLFGILRRASRAPRWRRCVLALQAGTPLRDALAERAAGPVARGRLPARPQPRPGRGGLGGRRGTRRDRPDAGRTGESSSSSRTARRSPRSSYEASLAEQPELVDAVVAAAGLAIRQRAPPGRAQGGGAARRDARRHGAEPADRTSTRTAGSSSSTTRRCARAGTRTTRSVRGRLFWDVFIDEGEREAMVERFRAAAPDFPATEYENTFTNPAASGSSSTGGARRSSTSTARSSASSPAASTSPSGTGWRPRRSASACS